MRYLIILFLALQLQTAFSAPRVDTAIGSDGLLYATVLPDDQNVNLFYVFPQTSEVMIKNNDQQDFLYIETRDYGRRSYRVMDAELDIGIRASIENPVLFEKIKEIKLQNPLAKFSVVTPFKSEIQELGGSKQFVIDTHCSSVGGPLEVPVYCKININPNLSYGFRNIITQTQTTVLQYIYHFYGSANGKISEYVFGVPLKVGSLHQGKYFFDQYGDRL